MPTRTKSTTDAAVLLKLKIDPTSDPSALLSGEPRTAHVAVPSDPQFCSRDSAIGRLRQTLERAEWELEHRLRDTGPRFLGREEADPAPHPLTLVRASGPVAIVVNGKQLTTEKPQPPSAARARSAEARLQQDPVAHKAHLDQRRRDAQDRLDHFWRQAVALRERMQTAERNGAIVKRADVLALVQLTGNLVAV